MANEHDFLVRLMTPDDLASVVELESRAHINPWSRELICRELEHAWATVFVCESTSDVSGTSVVGHIFFWLIYDEVHVLNVASDPERRRFGIGQRLVLAAEATGVNKGAVSSTLEVRRSNAPAIGLYRKLGYEQVGVRPGYYASNGEDALVMTKSLVDE